MTAKPKREGPLKVPFPFDEAIKRSLQVKPPAEGWKAYEKRIKQEQAKRREGRAKTNRKTAK